MLLFYERSAYFYSQLLEVKVMAAHPIEVFCCRNVDCPDFRIRGKGNLRWHGWSGHSHRIRGICCRTCRKYFSERKGSVFEQSRLPEEKVESLLEHLREGCGVRQTARLIHVNQNTVTRYARLAGNHAVLVHDELVAFSPQTREVQFDEKWSFVFKKEANCTPEGENCGDNWDHIAIDAESRLVLSVVPGKRTAENCLQLVEDVSKRTKGRTDLLLTSDEHAPYQTAIEKVYATEVAQPKRPGPGRPPNPKRVMPNDLCYATVRKTRKKGRVVDVKRTVVFGTLELLILWLARSIVSSFINTAFIERLNATDRGQNARKTRKSYRFSKNWEMHNAMTYFVALSYNFRWPVRTLRIKDDREKWKDRTPAMAAGLTDHVWTIHEWISFPALPVRST
ncbi:insertion element IS1 protein InsB [Gammaproteobacteria bacterium]